MMINNGLAPERRTKKDTPFIENFQGTKYIHDERGNIDVVKIFAGGWFVSTKGVVMLDTILGSCVSACIRDPVIGVGGMNHFLLPGDDNMENNISDSARYGVFAMECLINDIFKAGGQKNRLEVKVFGGGNVINNSSRIGSKNATFIRDFLTKEGFRIASEDLEGEHPRRINYYPDTGKVMVRVLKRQEDRVVVEEEAQYKKQINKKPVEGDIELF